jgi:hypothetical protein
VETVFKQALPEVSKFNIEYLKVREFHHVFSFLECKGADEEKVRELLTNILQADEQGKYSYLEFINEFKGSAE